MEEHPVIEREHTRVHEENKTEAGKVRWVQWVGPDDVGGLARRCGSGQMKMGTDPDSIPYLMCGSRPAGQWT